LDRGPLTLNKIGDLQERGDPRCPEEIPKEELNNAILAEVKRCERGRQGRNVWEVITAVHCVSEPFSMELGTLTQTMKLVRPAILEKYADSIAELTSRVR
jgi:long-subunit acyl-CoA synthetase (AMP-forming)